MTTIMVPRTRAEAPVGEGGGASFPEGSFLVTLEEVRQGDLPPWAGDPVNNGYTSGDGETISLQFGGARNAENPEESTNMKHFVEITVRDGDARIDTLDIPESSWKMQNDAALLLNLAIAWGMDEDVEFDGEVYAATPEGFLEDLASGKFNGMEVGVTTFHRKYAKKTDEAGKKTGVEVRTKEFFQVV